MMMNGVYKFSQYNKCLKPKIHQISMKAPHPLCFERCVLPSSCATHYMAFGHGSVMLYTPSVVLSGSQDVTLDILTRLYLGRFISAAHISAGHHQKWIALKWKSDISLAALIMARTV